MRAREQEHRQARCSDGIVRRFYAPTSEQYDDTYQLGFVMFNNLRTAGYIVPRADGVIKYVFMCVLDPSPIPLKEVDGWVQPVNCCAIKFCTKCKRCVGGCKK